MFYKLEPWQYSEIKQADMIKENVVLFTTTLFYTINEGSFDLGVT